MESFSSGPSSDQTVADAEEAPSVEQAFARLAQLAAERNTLEDPEAVRAALEAEEADRALFDAAPQQ